MKAPVILLPGTVAGTKERLQKRIEALRVKPLKLVNQERHQITGILIALVELGLLDLNEAKRLEAQADENHKLAMSTCKSAQSKRAMERLPASDAQLLEMRGFDERANE